MQETSGTQPSGSQTFRCKECGKVLNSAEDLREHTNKTHQGQGRGEQSQQPGQGRQSGQTRKAGGA